MGNHRTKEALVEFLSSDNFVLTENSGPVITFRSPGNPKLKFHLSSPEEFGTVLFHSSASGEFLQAWEKDFSKIPARPSEEEYF